MRKLCMTVALVLGLCLVAGADAKKTIPDEQLEALGKAIRLIPTDPQAADAALAEIKNSIATGWRMYIAAVTRPEDRAGYEALSREFNSYIGRDFYEDPNPSRRLENVLEHVMYAYLKERIEDPRACIPVWLFKRHPQEANMASWVNTSGGYSSLFIRDSYCPQEWPTVLSVPEYRDYRDLLYEMNGESSMGRCGGSMEYAYGAARWKWEYMVGVDVEFAKLFGPRDMDGFRDFISLWANKGIWEKVKVAEYRAQRAATIEATAGWIERHRGFSPEKATEYGTLIADGLARRILGRYPDRLLNKAELPWYVFASSPDSSPDELETVLPDTPIELNYMLHVSILNHQPIEIIRKLRDAGAILSESPENEVILAVDDAAYLEQILALGPYVDHVNGFGKSALCYAAQMGYVDSAKVLLAHGADVNRLTYELTKGQDRKSPIFWGDCCIVSYVRSPLIYACEQGNLDMVRLLLDHGADPSLAHIKWSASRSPEHTGLEWDRLLAKNPVMTPAEKETARHLLAGQ